MEDKVKILYYSYFKVMRTEVERIAKNVTNVDPLDISREIALSYVEVEAEVEINLRRARKRVK